VNDLAQLLITFFLTSILGGLFGYYLNRAAFKRQARLDLLKQRYQEGIAFLDDLSSQGDRRFFMLQRLLWAVDEQQPERLSRIETEYFQTVLDWNTALRSHCNKARLLVGQDFADEILDYADDHRPDDPRSLHYHFVKVHKDIHAAESGDLRSADAQDSLDRLN
jgi:hypothetical protein